MDSARIWSQSVARHALVGRERTHNPSPAASSMLGKKVVRKAKRALRRRGRKRAHKGNPSPALASLLGGALGGPPGALVGGLLGKFGGRFRAPSEKRAAAVVESVFQAAAAGNLTAARGLIERAAKPMKQAEHAVWAAAAARLSPDILHQVQLHHASIPQADQSSPEAFAQSVLTSPTSLPATGGAISPLQQIAGTLAQPGTVRALATVARGRSRRPRYASYVDRYGRQRYSYKPPGSQMRLPAGATPIPGTPYSFFTGALGAGGAATTVAQLGVAAAAGAAAYFGTQAILKYFGGRAVAQEEAGVQLALAARDARKEYALAHNLRGAPPTYGVPADVIRQIGQGMKQQLAELGYNEQGVRTRSGVETFLSDYAEQ